jgi:hypothetical protein
MEISISIAALALAFTILNTVYGWYSGTQRATKNEVEEHGRKIAALQTTIENMPSQEAFHKLTVDVVEIRADQRLLSEQMKPLASGIARIEKFLLDEIQTKPARRRT